MNKLGTAFFITGLTMSFSTGTALAANTADHPAEAAKSTEQKIEGMLLPFMSPSKGRKLFASKGCVVCHAINGIGGEDAPPLDANTMPRIMNPFDFAAKMWRGAGTMIAVQQDELGEQIEFSGEELANIIAFVHSIDEQKKFSKADIPPRITKMMGHAETEEKDHDEKEESEEGKKPKE